MAEPLKTSYGPGIPRRIGAMIAAAHPAFDSRAFVRDCLDGYDRLELLARGWKIADALHRHLPAEYPAAVDALVRSLGPPLAASGGNGMEPFLYMPHAFFVSRYADRSRTT